VPALSRYPPRILAVTAIQRSILVAAALGCLAEPSAAQAPASAIRITKAVALPGGQVLAADISHSRLLIMRARANGVFEVADSTTLRAHAWPSSFGSSRDGVWSFKAGSGHLMLTNWRGRLLTTDSIGGWNPASSLFLVVDAFIGDSAVVAEEFTTVDRVRQFVGRGRYVYMIDLRTRSRDTLARLRTSDAVLQVTRSNGSFASLPQPYSALDLFAVASNGRWATLKQPQAGRSGQVTVMLTQARRGPVATDTTVLSCRPPALTQLAANVMIDSLASLIAGGSSPVDSIRTRMRESLFVPAHIPVAARLLVSNDGTIWIGSPGARAGQLWTRVGRGASVDGPFTVPPGFRPLIGEDTTLIGVRTLRSGSVVERVVPHRDAAAGAICRGADHR
jgi:hypothetical protein